MDNLRFLSADYILSAIKAREQRIARLQKLAQAGYEVKDMYELAEREIEEMTAEIDRRGVRLVKPE